MLTAERQRVIAQLRLALPLHWRKAPDSPRRAAGGVDNPRYVRICGAVLPVDGDFSAALSVAEVSAGLGYVCAVVCCVGNRHDCDLTRLARRVRLLLHFVTLAARYLGAPLLHQGSFRVCAMLTCCAVQM